MSSSELSPDVSASYSNLSEDALFSLLGSTTYRPELGTVTLRALTVDDALLPMEIKELGERIFRRWSRALHDFCCSPTAEDKGLASKALGALSLKDGGATAVIAGVLVSSFGLAPATSAIVAALAIKLILKPAGEEICQAWDQQLKQDGA